jgi:hypothetical protein
VTDYAFLHVSPPTGISGFHGAQNQVFGGLGKKLRLHFASVFAPIHHMCEPKASIVDSQSCMRDIIQRRSISVSNPQKEKPRIQASCSFHSQVPLGSPTSLSHPGLRRQQSESGVYAERKERGKQPLCIPCVLPFVLQLPCVGIKKCTRANQPCCSVTQPRLCKQVRHHEPESARFQSSTENEEARRELEGSMAKYSQMTRSKIKIKSDRKTWP